MGFFDLPRPGNDEVGDELRDGPDVDLPGRWLGGVVPVEDVIGRSDRAAIAVRGIVAFEDGFELRVIAWVRKPLRSRARQPFLDQILFASHGPYGLRDEDGNIAQDLVRFGIQFPDGARITNLEDCRALSPDATEPRHGMEPQGGSSTNGEAEQEFWVWPIPETGNLTLVCEWPGYDIPESELTVDGDVLRDAAARSVPVWPGESTLSHFSSYEHLRRARSRPSAGQETPPGVIQDL